MLSNCTYRSAPSAEFPWFCKDPHGEGFTWWRTEDEALARAVENIEEWRGEEWPPEVEDILVGKVLYKATQTNIQHPCSPLDENGCDETGQYFGIDLDYACDVEMRPLASKEAP